MEKFDIVIVGCGLSGAVLAERYANILNKRVLIIDKRDHIGGNCYDYIDAETGIRLSKYGPHFFHTHSEKVRSYVQKFSEWVPWEHKVLGRINNKLFPIPVNITTVNILFEANIKSAKEMLEWLAGFTIANESPRNGKEVLLSQAGTELYELIYKYYTKKQWGVFPDKLDASILKRVPVRSNFDDRYFTDNYQAQPKNGFTKLIANMLAHPKIRVLLNTDFREVRSQIHSFKKLYFTGPVGHYFSDLQLGPLEYRSLRFESEYFKNTDYYQINSIINYPSMESDFTRIVEYKHVLHQESPDTVIFREYGSSTGEPYYPILNEKNRTLYNKYLAHAEKEKNVYFIGRLANFKYKNMDEAILDALRLFEKVEIGP